MADPTHPLTLSDIWLPGEVLGGAMLRGWTGPVWALRGTEWIGATWAPHMSEAPVIYGGKVDFFAGVANVRLDCRRPEVRDRAVRVIGPDLLPIHAAELRGEITPGEAAGLVWCSVVRRESGLSSLQGWHGEWRRCGPAGVPVRHQRWERGRSRRDLAPLMVTGTARQVPAYRERSDAAALATGYSLREPGGILLLPLPDGVVGRLECSNG